jgi:large subunit ribosomal protein L29
MKAKELQQKPEKELRELLAENQRKLGQLKFDLASKKLKNVMEIRELKKDIARILTLLNQFNRQNFSKKNLDGQAMNNEQSKK